MVARIKKYVNTHNKFFDMLIRVWRIKYIFSELYLKNKTKWDIFKAKKTDCKKIYYIGVPVHANLGDLAQWVCIRKWIKKHFASYHVVEIETNALVNTHFPLLNYLKTVFDEDNDFIVFQSGYTTTDLGGHADIVHQAVMNELPNAKILMMPQTIFFKSQKRKELCSMVYNSHKNMLFLARDTTSFEMAKKMFPDIPVICYPDIVTTLIGTQKYETIREGICFCLRDDGEKYYSDEELQVLINKCRELGKTVRLDTTKGNSKKLIKNAEKYIWNEIEEYSKYKVMITDRYHGTILSLVASTPVIIIRSTDHKVTTGANWFKGKYDDHVYVAADLEEAYTMAKYIYSRNEYPILEPCFEKGYYDKLPKLFEEKMVNG